MVGFEPAKLIFEGIVCRIAHGRSAVVVGVARDEEAFGQGINMAHGVSFEPSLRSQGSGRSPSRVCMT